MVNGAFSLCSLQRKLRCSSGLAKKSHKRLVNVYRDTIYKAMDVEPPLLFMKTIVNTFQGSD